MTMTDELWGKSMSTRLIDLGVVLVVALTALAGCASSSDGRSQSAAPPTAQATPSAAKAAPDTGYAVVPVDLKFTHFASPSGNIECVITSSGDGELVARSVRCDIDARDWSSPPRPTDCDLDYGHAILIGVGQPAQFLCAGDTTIGSGGEPLAYGEAISAGRLRCDSTRSGITCRDVESGHGFTISRQSYQLLTGGTR
jgi:hypothetical protein